FPLNVVVFPGMPMPLHIFEERYKEMINECLSEEQPFGIILIEQGSAEGDKNVVPRRIGCTVEISQVERLDDGRMYIMTFGQNRFKLQKVDRKKRPYLTGSVEYLELNKELEGGDDKYDRLKKLLTQYLEHLQKAGEVQFDVLQLPTEIDALAYIAASLLNIENDKKQSLLESNNLQKIVDYLLVVFQKEVSLLKMKPAEDMGAFSMN
ncbi:MAG: LON peptidase substrate-binding domain-containing protein, partial [Chloroflexota bacterium]